MMKFVSLILLALVASADPVSGETTSYAIQIESFKDLQKAAKKTDLLKKKGLDALWKEERPGGKASKLHKPMSGHRPFQGFLFSKA